MDTLDQGLKTFLVWKGLAHLAFGGYVAITFYLVLKAFELGAALTMPQAGLVTTMVSVGLPLFLNFYGQMMVMPARLP